MSLFIMVAHILCVFATASDPKRKGISNRLFKRMLLICPLASLMCGAAIYGYALSMNVNVGVFAKLFVGLLLIVVGNYLPKCRQNYTVGIKIPWTLHDEENRNHTHRLAASQSAKRNTPTAQKSSFMRWIILSLYQYVNTIPAIGDNTIIITEKVNDSMEVRVARLSEGNIS